MATEDQVIEVLSKINDPEIQLDVYTLGLIYEVKAIDENNFYIKMTFTTPTCPYGPMLVEEIKTKIEEELKAKVDIEITFNPPWQPSDELRSILGV
nr:metal-sulfur cluster assembly factor [Candidatus Woesearchaeota archaeon]